MKTVRIGISGINAGENPGPGVGLARALKEDRELNPTIVGFAYDALEPGVYLDWLFDKTYIFPYPSGGFEPYFERLAHIKQHFGLDFIIPSLDAELPLYTKYRQEIESLGIKTFLPTSEQFRLRGKDRLPEVAGRIGIDVPPTEVVVAHGELIRAIDQIGLPVMIKGAFYKAYRAYTMQEALGCYGSIVAEWGYPVIVQKAVAGEEMNVVGVGDGEGNALGLMGIKKMSVTAMGKIWTGVTVKHEGMLEAAERFVREFKWKGPFELECLVGEGKTFLIEINPRFPAWSYFAAALGLNLPANMTRRALGLPVKETPGYEAGKLFVRYTYELVTDMTPFREMVTRGEHPHATSL